MKSFKRRWFDEASRLKIPPDELIVLKRKWFYLQFTSFHCFLKQVITLIPIVVYFTDHVRTRSEDN